MVLLYLEALRLQVESAHHTYLQDWQLELWDKVVTGNLISIGALLQVVEVVYLIQYMILKLQQIKL